MSFPSGITKTETTERLNTLRGEGSMLREQIRDLKAKEARILIDLRSTMQDLEATRFKLNHVNNEIARLSDATG